ncbi:putative mRNA capping enzyme alpha subunit [Basidiobolus meristosporus CBS 931.73]|uniref:mRNA-capping enzyme subunit alpha n=1 Tax=Basidiobolus meristosporus CBS 931.73 TaxID=1314790 RepID=A0A1Y1YQT9_9FUNG|nr:putative mRNA capping enzyme alpha subunit [Basidiobolus meristosporus CBS 931.73]|eukprot:ORX99934.1 putative mRNA capping enzyme alpha subunit [Basidiobolus meristosporus CBS 931.73]
MIPDIPGRPVETELEQELRQEVGNLLNANAKRFPGAQPISFGLEHMHVLESEDYFVCEKSDGVRCLIYMRVNSKKIPETYLIDRKNKYNIVRELTFPIPDDKSFKKFHHQTIIDGEIIHDKEDDGKITPRFLAFDLLAIAGISVIEKPFTKRLGYLRDHVCGPFNAMIKKNPDLAKFLPFTVEAKKMELSYGLEMIIKQEMPRLKHESDGLIFTAVNAGYHIGTCSTMLKWKPPNENSIDFKLVVESQGKGKPNFNLHVWKGGREYDYFAQLGLTDDEWIRFRNNRTKLDGRIVEVTYDLNHCPPYKWKFFRFRDDKLHGNHISVVDKIVKSIDDGVESEALIEHCPAIRSAWKARHERANKYN